MTGIASSLGDPRHLVHPSACIAGFDSPSLVTGAVSCALPIVPLAPLPATGIFPVRRPALGWSAVVDVLCSCRLAGPIPEGSPPRPQIQDQWPLACSSRHVACYIGEIGSTGDVAFWCVLCARRRLPQSQVLNCTLKRMAHYPAAQHILTLTHSLSHSLSHSSSYIHSSQHLASTLLELSLTVHHLERWWWLTSH
jgi:hypothetical protein